jgi:CRISPR-associated protein Csm1
MNPWDELEAQERICDQCLSFVDEIGKDLPDSRFIAFGWEPPQESKKGRASDILAEFGMRFQLLENTSNAITLKSPRLTIWAFDDPPNEAYPESNSPASHQLRFLANQVPGYTFDELQKEVEGGFEKLGVLRLDLDNVGEIFRSGLGEHATLSRLAALSFQISLFFEGWIKKICDSGRRKDLVYTVYTGGDDAFLVGPWDIMPELALDISQQFNEYTGGHPDLHMSTGMSFIGGKYPIYQAAEDALQALEDAKGLDGKDAFTFLGKAWKWSDFKELKNKSQRLEELVTPAENGGMGGSQSILHHLQELSLEANEHKENRSRHVWGRWIWLGHYQLYRLSEMTKGEKLKQAIQGINQDLHKNNYSDIDQWGAASRWVQLKIRKVSGKE